MPADLKVEVSHDGGTVIIKFIGEARIDVERAAVEIERIIILRPKNILADASELTYISSIGLSLFVNLNRTAKKSGGVVTLVALQPFVHEALVRACLLNFFHVQPDMASALASITKS